MYKITLNIIFLNTLPVKAWILLDKRVRKEKTEAETEKVEIACQNQKILFLELKGAGGLTDNLGPSTGFSNQDVGIGKNEKYLAITTQLSKEKVETKTKDFCVQSVIFHYPVFSGDKTALSQPLIITLEPTLLKDTNTVPDCEPDLTCSGLCVVCISTVQHGTLIIL